MAEHGGGRKKKHGPEKPPPEPDQSEVRWLISYSDFMMQLVCLFILLYSVSSADTSKLAAFVEGWKESQGLKPARVSANPPDATTVPLTSDQVPKVIAQIQHEMGRYPDGTHIRITATMDGFQMQLVYPMFDEGSDRLTPQAIRLLDLAAFVLKPYERRVARIEIVGHTSSDDGDTDQGSALRLSLARSREAFRWVTREEAHTRLLESVLAPSGRGPHDPVEDNGDPARRPANRRVDFVVRLHPKT